MFNYIVWWIHKSEFGKIPDIFLGGDCLNFDWNDAEIDLSLGLSYETLTGNQVTKSLTAPGILL